LSTSTGRSHATTPERAPLGAPPIRPGTARFLTFAFLVVLLLPAGWQVTTDNGVSSLVNDFPRDFSSLGFDLAKQRLEKRFDTRSAFAEAVRLPYRTFVLNALEQPSGNTKLGSDGFLFHGDEVKYVTGDGILSEHLAARIAAARDDRKDLLEASARRLMCLSEPSAASPPYVGAERAVRTIARQIRARGIHLLVVPIPGKVAIYPEYCTSTYPASAGPARNRDFLRWSANLQRDGIDVVDLYQPLWEAKEQSSELLYLKVDSHWAPAGIGVAADVIAARANTFVRPAPSRHFPMERKTITYRGDQIHLLGVWHSFANFPTDTITETQITHGTGDEIIGDKAPVLLLGDSFAMVFQDHGGPGCGAGLAAQLMRRLGRGVQTAASQGITPAAELERLRDRPEYLKHKKLVIWTFIDRMLGNPKAWEEVELSSR
jgi:alginate O-acetyltransferase complex protein AlgJ